MERKHSPGPWDIEDDMVFGGGVRVAICEPNEDDDPPRSEERIQADMNLIAAAPTLLDAAIEAQSAINKVCMNYDDDNRIYHILKDAWQSLGLAIQKSDDPEIWARLTKELEAEASRG